MELFVLCLVLWVFINLAPPGLLWCPVSLRICLLPSVSTSEGIGTLSVFVDTLSSELPSDWQCIAETRLHPFTRFEGNLQDEIAEPLALVLLFINSHCFISLAGGQHEAWYIGKQYGLVS